MKHLITILIIGAIGVVLYYTAISPDIDSKVSDAVKDGRNRFDQLLNKDKPVETTVAPKPLPLGTNKRMPQPGQPAPETIRDTTTPYTKVINTIDTADTENDTGLGSNSEAVSIYEDILELTNQ